MTTTVISTTIVAAGVQHTFAAAGDDLLILPGATLGSTTTATLAGLALANLSVSVHGTLLSDDMISMLGSGANVTIGAGGHLVSFEPLSGSAGLFLNTSLATLTNAGSIEAATAIAVLTNGGASVTNGGTITGASGLFMGLFGATGDSLLNSGLIAASAVNDANANSRFNNAVQVEGGNTRVINLAGGTLAATSLAGAGVHVQASAGGTVVLNHGTITSMQAFGVDFSELAGTSTAVLRNFGSIFGGTGAFHGAVTTDTLRNAGTLDGTVQTEAGADLLVNRGTITGTVLLGDDGDVLDNRLGLIDDVVDLGAGNDRLDSRTGTLLAEVLGGLGNDTMLGNAALSDTLSGGDGIDTLDFSFGSAVILALDNSFDADGAARGDTYTGFERVFGSIFAADRLHGDTAANSLFGQGGKDVLEGVGGSDALQGGGGADVLNGGTGGDSLNGGLGNDVFLYTALADFGDSISDFTNAPGQDDRFNLARSDLGGALVVGKLAGAFFQTRADNLAQDTNDRFVFRTTDHTLWYDADGSGVTAAVMVADLQPGAVVTNADIFIL